MGSYGQSQTLNSERVREPRTRTENSHQQTDVKHRLETSNEVSMMESNKFGADYVIRSTFGHSMLPIGPEFVFWGSQAHTHTPTHTPPTDAPFAHTYHYVMGKCDRHRDSQHDCPQRKDGDFREIFGP